MPVALLILINLLAPRIVLLEIKLILPVMQVMFLQYLLHHLRHRFIHEKRWLRNCLSSKERKGSRVI